MKDISLVALLAVGLGGALGAVARFVVSTYLAHKPGEFPLATLCVNVLGSFLMGVAFVVITQQMILPPLWRQILMVGFLGALTTFSTFSLDAYLLWQSGHSLTAVSYILLNVLLCIAAVYVAVMLTEKLV